MWQRRDFLKMAGAGFAAGLMPQGALALERADLVLVSACQKSDGDYAAALLDETGGLIATVDLPGRGHDVTQCRTTGRLVVFARRPGTFAIVLSPKGETLATITSVPGRHFFGHGVFSPDGKLLYATENDYDAARGVIGVYDATDGFQRVGEFESNGIGPHDLTLSADGRVMCIANGGIETHPDFGRQKLNIPIMQPNLTFIDPVHGDVIATQALDQDLHQLSLRHLAPGADGTVWVGGQYQGAPDRLVPLVARAGPDLALDFAPIADPVLAKLSNYVGSVAANAEGDRVMVTSPVGGTALVLDGNGAVLAEQSLASVCGAASAQGGFYRSTGEGQLIDAADRVVSEPVKFDNHLYAAAG
ncbi:DUF1513 domain-containing protein [Cucumibacter marinus]|uniref:DUF1513 domain-containing protein n=1 Tax=Cucumibacter marinus TaxID=1121252 RepID=UPI00040A5748|nr:DUF1513 domain-containing protein [Cucumibacter marinus]